MQPSKGVVRRAAHILMPFASMHMAPVQGAGKRGKHMFNHALCQHAHDPHASAPSAQDRKLLRRDGLRRLACSSALQRVSAHQSACRLLNKH